MTAVGCMSRKLAKTGKEGLTSLHSEVNQREWDYERVEQPENKQDVHDENVVREPIYSRQRQSKPSVREALGTHNSS